MCGLLSTGLCEQLWQGSRCAAHQLCNTRQTIMPVPLLHLLLTCLLVAASASSPCELGCLPASMAPTVDECRLLADSPFLLPDGPGNVPRGELKRCCDDAYTTYVGLKTEDLETDIKIAKRSKHAWRIAYTHPFNPYRARRAHSHAR